MAAGTCNIPTPSVPGPGATPPAGGNGRPWPGWLAVPTRSVSDLLMLASLRFDLDRGRYPAGVIEAVGWVLETNDGPGTGRREGPQSRQIALGELCAAEAHALEDTDRSAPPLRQVCAELGVPYVPARTGDPEFGLGAWATLTWLLGESPEAPMRLPLRGRDGHVLTVGEILPSLVASGMHRDQAAAEAAEMAEDSRRLAELVRVKAATRY